MRGGKDGGKKSDKIVEEEEDVWDYRDFYLLKSKR